MRRSLLLLLLAAACGGDASSPGAAIDGMYQLATVNGHALPYTDDSSATRVRTVLSGTVLLAPISAGASAITITTVARTVYPGLPTETGSESTVYDVTFADDQHFSFFDTCVTASTPCTRLGVADGTVLTVTTVGGVPWRYTR